MEKSKTKVMFGGVLGEESVWEGEFAGMIMEVGGWGSDIKCGDFQFR